MPQVKLYNMDGAAVGELRLSDAVFAVPVNEGLVQQAVLAQQANSRVAIAHAKDRSEVRGGGRKPWRQKGTGRARHGSIRSPLWRGGGVTFGPRKEQNFEKKINKKAKRKALAMALSGKVSSDTLIALDQLTITEIKTKKFFEILQNLKLRPKKAAAKKLSPAETKKSASATKGSKELLRRKILVVLPSKDEKLQASARNIAGVQVINAASLNIVDVLKNQYVVLSKAAIEKIEATMTKR